MKRPNEKMLDELLNIAERISSAKVSDSMKESIFSYLLKQYKSEVPQGNGEKDGDEGGNKDEDFVLNGTVKRFLRTFKLAEADVPRVFHLDPDAVDFVIPELKVKSNVEGVGNCILLTGLKNALQSGKFMVVVSEVRELADNFGVYDSKNFSYAMKQHQSWLKNYKPGTDSELSGKGVKAASELMAMLIAE